MRPPLRDFHRARAKNWVSLKAVKAGKIDQDRVIRSRIIVNKRLLALISLFLLAFPLWFTRCHSDSIAYVPIPKTVKKFNF
jgi:hypothetical protein